MGKKHFYSRARQSRVATSLRVQWQKLGRRHLRLQLRPAASLDLVSKPPLGRLIEKRQTVTSDNAARNFVLCVWKERKLFVENRCKVAFSLVLRKHHCRYCGKANLTSNLIFLFRFRLVNFCYFLAICEIKFLRFFVKTARRKPAPFLNTI